MWISTLHLLVKALDAMVRLGVKMNLPSKYHVYNHPDDGAEGEMRQRIKDRLIPLSSLLAIDRLQHNHIGNIGNTARDFFDPSLSTQIAKILNVPSDCFRSAGHLARALKCGHMLDLQVYRQIAENVHKWWYKLLPKGHMPVALHILLKHALEYQELLGIPVGTTSEEPLEHLQRIIRDVLRRHTLTCSLEAAHASLLKYMMMCS